MLYDSEKKWIRVIQGSMSDSANTNLVLAILRRAELSYRVSCASCHWHAGGAFKSFLDSIQENIIGFIGGLELAAPGIIEAIFRNAKEFNKLVVAIPTDKAARSAVENLPFGTFLFTPGLNEISTKHSIQNGGLMLARLIAFQSPEAADSLGRLYDEIAAEKQLNPEIELDEKGLIPIKEKEDKK